MWNKWIFNMFRRNTSHSHLLRPNFKVQNFSSIKYLSFRKKKIKKKNIDKICIALLLCLQIYLHLFHKLEKVERKVNSDKDVVLGKSCCQALDAAAHVLPRQKMSTACFA